MENREKTIHVKASTVLCTDATERRVAFCVSEKPQKRRYSESLSKYASFLGKTGWVGSSAAEAPGFRPRCTAEKGDFSHTRTVSYSCSRLVRSLQGRGAVAAVLFSLGCDSTEVPGRASPGPGAAEPRGGGAARRGRSGRRRRGLSR